MLLKGWKRSMVHISNWNACGWVLAGFVLIFTVQLSLGITNPEDVAAINNLYVSLGSPPLPRWVTTGGDPCAENWQGVSCNGSSISSIIINSANLGGELGDNLGLFSSIKRIDFSNNQIGGSIPPSLPVTLQHFFLSDNQLTGSIPISLSFLTQLSDMSLNDNHLTGNIPDSFESIVGLINLDLSNNNLSGQLPPSVGSLASLTTLRMQNNQLFGTLDVLQDLPLRDLNIENNLFSGPIPDKLLSIPTFKSNGNLFNSTIAPVAPPMSLPFPPPEGMPTLPGPPTPPGPPPPPPASGAPSSTRTRGNQASQPSASEESKPLKGKKFLTTKKIVWISISGVLLFVILALALLLLLPQHTRRRQEAERYSKQETGLYKRNRGNAVEKEPMVQSGNEVGKVPRQAVVMPKEEHKGESRTLRAVQKQQDEQPLPVQKSSMIQREDSEIDMSMIFLPPPPPSPPPAPSSPPPPPTPPPTEKVDKNAVSSPQASSIGPLTRTPVSATSVKFFTIAALQQYTNSFSQDNLIGGGMLGTVYKAQLPDGKLLAVKKLDKAVSSQQKDDEFVEMVNSIDRIRNANVVKLMGYCAEHGQRLLVYEYCTNGTLQDALHSDDESRRQLSWNNRVRIALGAARALWYLHEVCEPPVVHRNLKSGNILLDDELSARVSDCGLAPLLSTRTARQLSGHLLSAYGYGAPEFELGTYTYQSDVYSFGVVMLELLTGRKSYDRTRHRGEQFLVRWAIPQLHDIDLLSKMVDPLLSGEYPAKSLSHFADIIARCVQSEPEFRPAMSEVVQDLLDMLRKENSPNN